MSARDAGWRAITLCNIRDGACCALAPVRSKGSTGLQPSLFMPYLPLHWRLAVSSLSMSSLKQMTLSVNMRLLPDIVTWGDGAAGGRAGRAEQLAKLLPRRTDANSAVLDEHAFTV